MISSRLTSKARTTIPRSVRTALQLREGDELVYQIRSGRVFLSKAQPDRLMDHPISAFAEWDSVADSNAYAEL